MTAKKRLGEMLLETGVIDETQLKAALGHQRKWGMRLGQALVELKLATEADVVGALSAKLGVDVANLAAMEPHAHEQAVRLFPREFTTRNNVLPMAADTAVVTVAMSDPANLAVVDEIRFRTGRRVKVCIGGDREIAEAVSRSYPGGAPVEAIALDLDAEPAVAGEQVFDPFGGGSKDALEAFFGGNAGPAPAAGQHAGRLDRAPPAAGPRAAGPGVGRALAVDAAPDALDPEELTPLDDGPQGEAVLASDLAPPEEGAAPGSRELTPRELAILNALEDLASGAPVEPTVVKPAQAMAAMIRLLIRKRIVTDEEFLDELRKK